MCSLRVSFSTLDHYQHLRSRRACISEISCSRKIHLHGTLSYTCVGCSSLYSGQSAVRDESIGERLYRRLKRQLAIRINVYAPALSDQDLSGRVLASDSQHPSHRLHWPASNDKAVRGCGRMPLEHRGQGGHRYPGNERPHHRGI